MQSRAAFPAALLVSAVLASGCAAGSDPSTVIGPATSAARSVVTDPTGSPSPSTGGTSSSPAAAVSVTVAGGRVVGGVKTLDVAQGDRVQVTVTSDVADEIHVHGVDLHRDIAAGGTQTIDFTANLPGSYEIELESLGLTLVRYNVR